MKLHIPSHTWEEGKVWAGCSVQQLKALGVPGIEQRLCYWFSFLLKLTLGKVAGDDSRARAPATHVRDLEGVPSCGLWSGPVLVVATIWGVSQGRKDLCLS